MMKTYRKPHPAGFMVVTLFGLIAGWSMADDAKPPPAGKSDEKPAKQPADSDQPKAKSYLEKLGDELFKEVDDNPEAGSKKTSSESDKMERAVKGMRIAGDKLDEGMTAEETQKIQKQVIKDLDDIINQLENPPPNQGGGGGGAGGSSGGAGGRNRRGGGGAQMRMRRPQGAGSRGMAAGQQRQGQTKEEEDGEQSGDKGTDSSKQAQAARKAAEEAERRRKLEMDIWGHLPPHLREELLSTYGERMLPKYEHLVKQFYEALSTQNSKAK